MSFNSKWQPVKSVEPQPRYWPSMAHAARDLKVSRAAVDCAVISGRPCKGVKLVWGDELPAVRPKIRKRPQDYWVPVKTLENPPRKWPSMAHAARALGVGGTSVTTALLKGCKCKGVYLTYGDLLPGTKVALKPPKVRHKVECVDTGEKWPSVYAAVNKDKTAWMQLRRAISRGEPWRDRKWKLVG